MSEPKQENVTPMAGPLVKQNSTHGQPLPPNLQHELEVRSGASLDGYRVHYRSALPTHLDARAYTRGSDIHIGPGQENHLPHEAWHVVQQKQQGEQGRVQGTNLAPNLAVQNSNHAVEQHSLEESGSIPLERYGPGGYVQDNDHDG